MNKIQEVKEKINIVDVAKQLGIKLDRGNKTICPFHNETTPSFSISGSKQIFKCFGCGEGGDVISLVEKILKINAYASAKWINDSFRLGVDFGKPTPFHEINEYKQKQRVLEEFKKKENYTFQLLCDYLHSLKRY